jgi:hypothetical protein
MQTIDEEGIQKVETSGSDSSANSPNKSANKYKADMKNSSHMNFIQTNVPIDPNPIYPTHYNAVMIPQYNMQFNQPPIQTQPQLSQSKMQTYSFFVNQTLEPNNAQNLAGFPLQNSYDHMQQRRISMPHYVQTNQLIPEQKKSNEISDPSYTPRFQNRNMSQNWVWFPLSFYKNLLFILNTLLY